MKQIFDHVSASCSKLTTRRYSTSFSLGIRFLSKKFHDPIYGVYGGRIRDKRSLRRNTVKQTFRPKFGQRFTNSDLINFIANSQIIHRRNARKGWVFEFLDILAKMIRDLPIKILRTSSAAMKGFTRWIGHETILNALSYEVNSDS